MGLVMTVVGASAVRHLSPPKMQIGGTKMVELDNFVKLQANCTDCKLDKTVELTAKMEALYSEGFNAFVAGGLHECRAYGDGVPLYNALITAIKARATLAAWAACPP